MEYLKVFVTGGIICAIAELLIDKTKLTSGRILVFYVVTGCILCGLGIYEYIENFGGAGATVPLTGFGYNLAKGVMKEVDEAGFLGIFTGGFKSAAGGIGIAILFSLITCVFFKPKSKG